MVTKAVEAQVYGNKHRYIDALLFQLHRSINSGMLAVHHEVNK